jgi:hypothetical protein
VGVNCDAQEVRALLIWRGLGRESNL